MADDVDVTQADRDAAADIWRDYVAKVGEVIAENQMRKGDLDFGLPTLLARHREASSETLRAQVADLQAKLGEAVHHANAMCASITRPDSHEKMLVAALNYSRSGIALSKISEAKT